MAEQSSQAQVAAAQEGEQAKKVGKTVARLETRITYTSPTRLLLGVGSDDVIGD